VHGNIGGTTPLRRLFQTESKAILHLFFLREITGLKQAEDRHRYLQWANLWPPRTSPRMAIKSL
jgi:hypothetical protein